VKSKKELIIKLLKNKKNNQFSIALPKSKLKPLKGGKTPKGIKLNIKEEDWIW
jgi:hypothetical protein